MEKSRSKFKNKMFYEHAIPLLYTYITSVSHSLNTEKELELSQ